jgi:hypothetical protein
VKQTAGHCRLESWLFGSAQKLGLIFKRDRESVVAGQIFHPNISGLRRLFDVRTRIERYQSSSPETEILTECYRPEVKSATVRRDQRNPVVLFFSDLKDEIKILFQFKSTN